MDAYINNFNMLRVFKKLKQRSSTIMMENFPKVKPASKVVALPRCYLNHFLSVSLHHFPVNPNNDYASVPSHAKSLKSLFILITSDDRCAIHARLCALTHDSSFHPSRKANHRMPPQGGNANNSGNNFLIGSNYLFRVNR